MTLYLHLYLYVNFRVYSWKQTSLSQLITMVSVLQVTDHIRLQTDHRLIAH